MWRAELNSSTSITTTQIISAKRVFFGFTDKRRGFVNLLRGPLFLCFGALCDLGVLPLGVYLFLLLFLSHCVFTIKLVRLPDVDEPHYATVSRLSLVDLAGSERHNSTKTTGTVAFAVFFPAFLAISAAHDLPDEYRMLRRR